MFESNPAAFMVIPMAISLAFGVAVASVFTLFLVPSLYAILEDLQHLWDRRSAAQEETSYASEPGSSSPVASNVS